MQYPEKFGEELEKLDLFQFNEGKNPYPERNNTVVQGFGLAKGVKFMRSTVRERVGFTGGRVLDLLSGHGRWSIFLAECNTEVVGVERVSGAVALAENMCRHFGLDNTRFICDDYSIISTFESESFDYVWLYGALHNIDREFALSQVTRLLRPGGRIFVSNYTSNGIMIQHVIDAAGNNAITTGTGRWALGALQNGTDFNGKPNIATLESVPQIAEDFGLELIAAAPDLHLDVRNPEKIQQHPEAPRIHGGQLSTIEFLLRKPEDHPGHRKWVERLLAGTEEQVARCKHRLRFAASSNVDLMMALMREAPPRPAAIVRRLLSQVPDVSVKPLVAALDSDDEKFRRNAATALAEMKEAAIGALAMRWTESGNFRTDALIVEILTKIAPDFAAVLQKARPS